MASHPYGTLYCGVTSNLPTRVFQHRQGAFDGFSRDRSTHRLVWFERHERMDAAILREKRIKKWYRQWRINLIEAANPNWRDLGTDIGLSPLQPRPMKVERVGVGSPPSRG